MQFDLISLRHHLHQNPELSGFEMRTSETIAVFCEKFDPTFIYTKLGGEGVAIGYEGAEEGPTIMIRCELDALPIAEQNNFSYCSAIKGISHKCGHDGHMTIVAGLAERLHNHKISKGRVVLCFQPAEETGRGAEAVLRDPKFENIRPDYIFALHNIPGCPVHKIILLKNQFSATVQSAKIYLGGLQSHASEPENGINPTLALAELANYFNHKGNDKVTEDHLSLITPVFITCGTKDYGISAGQGEFHITCRTWMDTEMANMVEEIEQFVKQTARKHNLESKVEWFDYFPPTLNDPNCNNWIEQAARKNGLDYETRHTPFRFGEDFGWFSQEYPSAMFGLGSGIDTPNLHNPQYDFPDEIIPTGVNMFEVIIREILR